MGPTSFKGAKWSFRTSFDSGWMKNGRSVKLAMKVEIVAIQGIKIFRGSRKKPAILVVLNREISHRVTSGSICDLCKLSKNLALYAGSANLENNLIWCFAGRLLILQWDQPIFSLSIIEFQI
jgi:hypothetical protein